MLVRFFALHHDVEICFVSIVGLQRNNDHDDEEEKR